jgi:uncharacterized phage protein (TIGR01671 family)
MENSSRFTFRAWDIENKEMTSSMAITMHNGQIYRSNLNVTQHYEIMQSTGLKDKNDKLIFEGDILKWQDVKVKIQKVTFDKYEDNEGWVDDVHLGYGFYSNTLPDVIKKGGIVIGNIYENPELLKEGKK